MTVKMGAYTEVTLPDNDWNDPMCKRDCVVIAVLALLAANSVCLAEDAELLVNGGFQVPAVESKGLASIKPGKEPPQFGWSVEQGDVEVFDPRRGDFTTNSEAVTRCLDLNGVSVGAISQTFDTYPGDRYNITIRYAGNHMWTNSQAPAKAIVNLLQVDDVEKPKTLVSETLTHETSSKADLNWQVKKLTFVARGYKTRLQIQSGNPRTPYGGLLLDEVSVKLDPSVR